MSSEHDRLCQRVKITERTCLLLGIGVLLLAFSEIRQAFTIEEIVGTFDFLTEQLNLICQQVDAIAQCIRNLH